MMLRREFTDLGLEKIAQGGVKQTLLLMLLLLLLRARRTHGDRSYISHLLVVSSAESMERNRWRRRDERMYVTRPTLKVMSCTFVLPGRWEGGSKGR